MERKGQELKMSKTADECLTIHVVHSVKGGCGKTAFSLFKALSCADISTKSHAEVLYFDADFKGTSIKTLIYGENEKSFDAINEKKWDDMTPYQHSKSGVWTKIVFRENYNPATLNDIMKGEKKNFIDIVQHGAVLLEGERTPETAVETEQIYSFIDFVFSSPEAADRAIYEYGMDGYVDPKLTQGRFKAEIKGLFNQIYKYGMDKECPYKDVVIDMPPGEEEFSQTMLMVLEKWASETNSKKRKVKLNYYAVTTNDRGHLYAEVGNFMRLQQPKSTGKSFDKYIVVLNELREGEFTNPQAAIEFFQGKIKEKVGNRFFCINKFSNSYYSFCRDNTIDCFDYNITKEEAISC